MLYVLQQEADKGPQDDKAEVVRKEVAEEDRPKVGILA